MSDKQALASFTTNGFVSNPYAAIGLGTLAGMFLMSITTAMGMPIVVSMAALFGGILLVYGYKSGRVEYNLYEDGIKLNIRKFIPYELSKKESERWVAWEDVKSYRIDKDWSRAYSEYEYLKLYLKVNPGQIWITNQKNKEGFEQFKTAFVQVMEGEVQQKKEGENTRLRHSTQQKEVKANIKRKGSWYKSNFAKFLTVFFILVTAILIAYAQLYDLALRHQFRLYIILIPGTMYMIYRVFMKVED